ncbi:MAG: hypothetical protein RIR66_306 [Actinomycetota bacterium]|jgi:hypothetical protein
MNYFLMSTNHNEESITHELADDSRLLVDSLGGPRGMLESGLPSIIFVIAFASTESNLRVSVYSALAAGLVLAVIRLVQKQKLTQVIAGLIGLAFSAWLATKSGKSENFFLPGILTNVAYGAACIISIAINKPLLGYVIESLKGSASNWTTNQYLMRKYRALTFLWTAVFAIRVLVMAPLYFANNTVALGFFKLALGWPLFALAAYATYAMSIRKTSL